MNSVAITMQTFPASIEDSNEARVRSLETMSSVDVEDKRHVQQSKVDHVHLLSSLFHLVDDVTCILLIQVSYSMHLRYIIYGIQYW